MATGVDTETAQRLRIVFGRLARMLRPTAASLAADLTPTRAAVLLNTVRNGPVRLAEVAAGHRGQLPQNAGQANGVRLRERAEELGQKLKEQSMECVLCHSDIHGGNVLIEDENTLYIVDWDEPMMASKERDLMFIGGGVANVWNKPHEEQYFYKGYGATEINREIRAYYRHERIVEDIALFYQQLRSPSISDLEKHAIYKLFIDMFKSQGVVDIAFKTK